MDLYNKTNKERKQHMKDLMTEKINGENSNNQLITLQYRQKVERYESDSLKLRYAHLGDSIEFLGNTKVIQDKL